MWVELQAQYNELVNAVINQIGQPVEILVAMIGVVANYIEKLVDDMVYKYTGFHILEIYNMCIKAFNLIRQIKALNKPNLQVSVGVTINKGAMKKKLYEELYTYLENISTPLYNAFLMLQIKETILEIKDVFDKFTNISLEEMKRQIDSLDDVVMLLDNIMSQKPIQVGLSEIIANGMNGVMGAANQLKKAADAAPDTSRFTNMSAQDITSQAMGLVDFNVTATKSFTIDMGEEKDGKAQVSIVFNKEPKKLIKNLNKVFRDVQIEGVQVFSSTAIQTIIDKFRKIWEDPQNNQPEFDIAGQVSGQ